MQTEITEDTRKPCSKCGKEKRLDEFGSHPKGKYGRQSACTDCETKRKRAYLKEHPQIKKGCNERNRQRRKQRRAQDYDAQVKTKDKLRLKKQKFGLAPEIYLSMQENTKGMCEICGQPETACNQWGPLPLAVDHDHVTGHVRGMLCMACNLKLSVLEDGAFVEKAQAYLDRYCVKQTS